MLAALLSTLRLHRFFCPSCSVFRPDSVFFEPSSPPFPFALREAHPLFPSHVFQPELPGDDTHRPLCSAGFPLIWLPDNALSEELLNHHGVLLHLDFLSPQGFRGVKKSACRALSLIFHTGSAPQDRSNAPRTTSVKDVLFPLVKNRCVSYQFQHYRNTTMVSLNCSKVTQRTLLIHTLPNSFLTASFLNQLNPISF